LEVESVLGTPVNVNSLLGLLLNHLDDVPHQASASSAHVAKFTPSTNGNAVLEYNILATILIRIKKHVISLRNIPAQSLY
jgi:hypothetical protein